MSQTQGRRRDRWLVAAFSLAIFLTLASPKPAHAANRFSLALQPQSSASSRNRQIVKESREAAGEDENAQFKHSASVRLISKITGLDLENSYWLSIGSNFAVIAIVILWFSKKYLPGMFRSRTASIQKAMEEARKVSEDANRRLAEVESRLSKLGQEIGEMRASAEKDGAAEEQRIKTAAVEDARKIVESVEQEITAAAKSARRELTAYAADLAVSLAQKQIRVDAATDAALVQNFAKQLAANGGERKDRQ